MPQVLPLEPSIPSYRVGTSLGGRQFILDLHWNARDQGWYMDVLDPDEDPIRVGIKIALGAMLGVQTADARWPRGILVAHDLSGEDREAGLDDLGTRVVVYFYHALELT